MSRVFRCPFFSWAKGTSIWCEGGVLKFRSMESYRDYVNRYCCGASSWGNCTIAQNLEREYERRDQDDKREEL